MRPLTLHLAPPDYSAGGATKRLVSFVDFAPTLLSVTGEKAPEWMQGSPFMGSQPGRENRYLFGFRGRMDERYDMVRCVTDGRYVYVRNFMPHRPHGQHLAYQMETPTTKEWYRQFRAGRLRPEQAAFWTKHPDIYERSNGAVRLKIAEGVIRTKSLNCPGFASEALPDWKSMKEMA